MKFINIVSSFFTKMKNGFIKLSFGKKIYVVLWSVWVVFLITIIGMFSGLKSTYSKSTPPLDGWTIKANQSSKDQGWINAIKYTDGADNIAALRNIDSDNYFIYKKSSKDKAEQTKIDNAQSVSLTAIKTELINNGTFTNETWNTLIGSKKLFDAIPLLVSHFTKDGKVNDEEVNKIYSIEYMAPNGIISTTVSLSDAKKEKDYSFMYDDSISWANIAEKMLPLSPFYAGDASYKRNMFSKDSWNTTPTDEAKTAINATAAIGVVFIISMIAAISSTVIVSIKEKGGSK